MLQIKYYLHPHHQIPLVVGNIYQLENLTGDRITLELSHLSRIDYQPIFIPWWERMNPQTTLLEYNLWQGNLVVEKIEIVRELIETKTSSSVGDVNYIAMGSHRDYTSENQTKILDYFLHYHQLTQIDLTQHQAYLLVLRELKLQNLFTGIE